jgi:hypothetical protein
MMQYDRMALDLHSEREFTKQGYLRAPARVARTGVQHYYAVELGLHDREPTERVGVLRDEKEVFATDSLNSYRDVDITNNHPDAFIDAHSYKDLAVGNISGAPTPEGDYVRADLIIRDKATIDAIESGKVQVSAGYDANYERKDGVHDGVPYQFIQRHIRVNHVALVDKARAGASARIYDGDTAMHKLQIGDAEIEVTSKEQLDAGLEALKTLDKDDGDKPDFLEKKKDKKDKDKKESDDSAAVEATRDALSSELEAARSTIRDLEDQLTADSFDAKVAIRQDTIDKAKTIAKCETAVFAGKSIDGIALTAMKLADPDRVAWDEKSPAYVSAAFDMQYTVAARAKNTHTNLAADLSRAPAADGAPARLDDTLSMNPEQAQQVRDAAYEKYRQRLET